MPVNRPREPRRQRHLVAEVHRVARALEVEVARAPSAGSPAGCAAPAGPARSPSAAAASPRHPLGHRLHRHLELVDVAADVLRVEQVLGHLPGQRHDRLGDRRLGRGQLLDVAVVAADHLVGVLPRRRLGQQPRLRLVPEPQGVLANQPTRIRVVGRHDGDAAQRLGTVLVQGLGRPDPGVGEAAQPPADPLGQLGGGLAGEGEAEHLVGLDVAVGDQPDDARGHRLGLARSRRRPRRGPAAAGRPR